MPQSLAKNSIHLVFGTKGRRPYLTSSVGPQVFAYLAGAFQKWESPAIIVGGHVDHVHALFLLNKNVSLAKIVEEIKKGSSKWIKTLGVGLDDFAWQNGYGAFSVSESNSLEVRKYIENQEEHHRRRSFQDEFRELCARHGVEIDERYAWS